jgi:hypothetical protein
VACWLGASAFALRLPRLLRGRIGKQQVAKALLNAPNERHCIGISTSVEGWGRIRSAM